MENDPSSFEVLVVGAGPAGAAASIELGRAGARVLLCERGVLPRPRLCGEFLSPEAVLDLQALGLDPRGLGGVPLGSVRVTSLDVVSESVLPHSALGVSRSVLDPSLVRLAQEHGVRLETRTPVVGLRGDLVHGFEADLGGRLRRSVRTRLVIGAFGKQTPVFQERRSPDTKHTHVALKTHFVPEDNVPPRVELHALAGGYVGLAPVDATRVNVCLVATHEAIRRTRGRGPDGILLEMTRALRVGSKPLAALQRVEGTTVGESGMRFGVVHPTWGSVLLAGDAATLPHPVCGDGIAMALRAGRLAASYALGFMQGRVHTEDLVPAYARAWHQEFGSRLGWSRVVHNALEKPRCMRMLLRLMSVVPSGLPYLVGKTRGGPEGRFASYRPER